MTMRSMTGYGQATWHKGERSLTVEVRGVNQRHLEVKLNMPREYLPWEAELRALVQQQVTRGKVDVFITRGGTASGRVAVEVNLELAKAYVAAWRKMQRSLGLTGTIDVSLLQSRSDLLRVIEGRNDPSRESGAVRAALRRALANFNRERTREGRVLTGDMVARVRRLRQIHGQLAQRAQQLTPELAARLRERIAVLLDGAGIAEERLVQEAAVLAERADVTEELVRLRSHLEGLAVTMRGREAAGKKLDFLLQEAHREVNTIASKSADLTVTNLTVDARTEIDKLREQAQNIE